MPDNSKPRVTVYLDPDQYADLERIAKAERTSISTLLRQAADLIINKKCYPPMGELLRQAAETIKENENDRPTLFTPGNET